MQVLSRAGMPMGDIVVATAVASAVGSFIVGIFGNLPFGLAPGLGLSAYMSYGMVRGSGRFTSASIIAHPTLFID